ncbi:MAG: ABC transporter permease [Oscillospiraceae bacterium]|jgi:putative ABC transport system permease protein|nr:ABC transporter permease [Oscillospiraceae bacterium]
MLQITWGKIKNNLWLAACLLIGNILLIATASAIPMYAEGIMQRIFMKELESVQLESGRYPGQITFSVNPPQIPAELGLGEIDRLESELTAGVYNDFGVPVLSFARSASSRKLEVENSRQKLEAKLFTIAPELSESTELIAGRYPNPEIQPDNLLEVIATETSYITQNYLLDEEYTVKGMPVKGGGNYTMKVVGVVRAKNPSVSRLSTALYADSKLFNEIFYNSSRYRSMDSVQWIVDLDYHQFKVYKLDELQGAIDKYATFAPEKYYDFGARFGAVAEPFPAKQDRLNLTLWVLEVPIFILLAFFISMVARQILTLDRNEISVMKSRGATRPQIFLIYLIMNLILAGASLVMGIPIGMGICSMLGASSGFLELVSRAGLSLRLQPFALLIAAATALISTAVCVLPSLKFSKITIVAHKQSKSRTKSPIWQRLFIDVLLLAFSIYEYYNFSSHLAELSANGGGSIDPLLFLSSSLFMLGAGLLFVRLFNYVVKIIYYAGRRFWPPSLYTSFLKVMRSSGEEQFIMLFLVLTLATGVFNARIARTINLNNDDAIRYSVGADVKIKENWQINTQHSVGEITPTGDIAYTNVVYNEPDFSRYLRASEVSQATKVYLTDAGSTRAGNASIKNVEIIGIITDEFGEVAWLRSDLLPRHFYDYLNALAANPDAIIVSPNFRDVYSLKIGDRLTYTVEDNRQLTGVICGFADFWPGYSPTFTQVDYTGLSLTLERSLIVGNLGQMQRKIGVLPYEVWMRTDGGSVDTLYNYAENGEVQYRKFADLNAELIKAKHDPVFQGTNGVLTVGFLIILLVCAVGFLIYWILSIRSRELQFGIFRAMGLSMKDLVAMLLCEQVLISGASIAAGLGVGALTSTLFVPLIQVGYATGTHLPLIVAGDISDNARLLAVTGTILVVCMVILGGIIRRLKIAQALKLGED